MTKVDTDVMADEELELHKPLRIFGRDVTKIPCFRSSIMYGLGSGVAASLVVFMFTSRVQWASHALVGTFVVVDMGYWLGCRYQHAQQKFKMGQIRGAYKRALTLEGTEEGKKLQKNIEIADA